MKTVLINTALVIAASLITGNGLAQTTNKEEPKKVKVIIKENKNGQETVTELNELTPETKQKLKEKGIDISDFENTTGEKGKMVIVQNDVSIEGDGNNSKETKVVIKKSGNPNDPEMKDAMEKAMKESNVKVINENGVTKVIVDGKEVSSTKDGDQKEIKVFVFKFANITDASSSDCKKAGIKESNEKLVVNDITCSPNPSSGKFNLKFKTDDKTAPEIAVRDINGKIVYSEKATSFNGMYEKEISLDEAAKGIYFVTITQGQKAVTKKLVVE